MVSHGLIFRLGAVFSLLVFIARGANELALQVVDVTLVVEQVLLVIALDLDAAQAFLRQILRVVHVDHVVIVAVTALHSILGCGLLL